MIPIIQKIITLTEARIPYLIKNGKGWFYNWSETFVAGIDSEIDEMKEELKLWNRVFLEDELGDIFWDYICLLENLELEGKVSKVKVFERCWAKFSERLKSDGSDNGDWDLVKQKQKEKLRIEQDTL